MQKVQTHLSLSTSQGAPGGEAEVTSVSKSPTTYTINWNCPITALRKHFGKWRSPEEALFPPEDHAIFARTEVPVSQMNRAPNTSGVQGLHTPDFPSSFLPTMSQTGKGAAQGDDTVFIDVKSPSRACTGSPQ